MLLPNTTVTGFRAEDGRITKVITGRGEIRTPIVVDAAGAWTRLVGSLAGARVGAIATRHQLLITQPIPGVESHHPITRLIDCNLYVRPAEGGLMVGGYESDPLQLDMANLPAAFGVDDMTLDLSVLRRLIERAVDQFPILRDIAVKEHRGGLPTMTVLMASTSSGRCRGFAAFTWRADVVSVACRSRQSSATCWRNGLLAASRGWIYHRSPHRVLRSKPPTSRRSVRIAASSTPSITGRKSDMASHRKQITVVALMIACSVMSYFDRTIMSIAGPEIMKEFWTSLPRKWEASTRHSS